MWSYVTGPAVVVAGAVRAPVDQTLLAVLKADPQVRG